MILWAPVFRRHRVNKLARVLHRLEVYAPVLGAGTPLQTSTFSALQRLSVRPSLAALLGVMVFARTLLAETEYTIITEEVKKFPAGK